MPYKCFTELESWKAARLYRIECSKLEKTFPAHEKYKLCDQLVRSSRSIGDNISEGHGRFHYQENIQYNRTARGPLEESYNQLITAFDEKYITKEKLLEMKARRDRLLKLINGYISWLKKQKKMK